MPNDYGLSAMAGVLPTVMVAGVTYKIAESLFPQVGQPRQRRRKKRKTRR